MDEASSLVAELQRKLSELDHKVWQYRRDMATEFDKFSDSLLRDVSADVSETVSRTMRESMKGYKSLYPDGHGAIDSRPTGNSAVNHGSGASLPIPTPFRRVNENTHKDDSPRSPHQREKEFQGVFTPTYLPLLDSSSHRRSSSNTSTPAQDIQVKAMDMVFVDASTEVGKSLLSSPEVTRPPTPRRRNTDEVSTSSDVSDGAPRKSSLRRSSSGSKGAQSPRRVRFDVEGEVVLPTSSPLPPSTIAEEELGAPAFPSDDEADSEQIENIDSPSAPKRISSTQALRMISRSPLDDGTTWTAVSAPPDGSASVATSNTLPAINDEENDLSPVTNLKSAATTPKPLNIKKTPRSPPPETNQDSTSDHENTTSLRHQSHSLAAMLSPAIPEDISGSKSPTASTRSAGVDLLKGTKVEEADDLQDFDADEMFHFDEHTPDTAAYGSPLEAHSSPAEDSASDSDDGGLSISPAKSRQKIQAKSSHAETKPITLSSYSRSPARDIPQYEAKENKKDLGSSYKNHPFSVPIVKSDVLEQAEKMGDVESFVGSVDGRSGVDESDARSWKGPSLSGSSMRAVMGNGATRFGSLGERMMMEDRMEAEKEGQKRREVSGGRKK